jgi:diguanylate cyclase (GGDEF)-like protein
MKKKIKAAARTAGKRRKSGTAERKAAPLRAAPSPRLPVTPNEAKATIRRLRTQLARALARIDDLQASADTDFLLDIPNRRGFERELNRAISYIKRYHASGAMIVLDVDRLKPINDAYGHAAGDDALRAVAGVLESCGRRDDVLGRLGGDEFGWLLPGATPDDAVAAAERALRLAAAVETAAGDGALSLTAGIAVALTAVDGETLFERADGALREGKLAGRGIARLVGADRPRRQRPAPAAQRPQELLTTAARSVPELADLAAVEWSSVFRSSACAVSLIEGDTLRTIAFSAGLQPQAVDQEPYVIADYPDTVAAIAARQTRQIRADDLEADPRELEIMRRNDARTLLIVPLVVGDAVKGLIELYDSRPRVFSSDEQRLALALGRYLAASFERLATTT